MKVITKAMAIAAIPLRTNGGSPIRKMLCSISSRKNKNITNINIYPAMMFKKAANGFVNLVENIMINKVPIAVNATVICNAQKEMV